MNATQYAYACEEQVECTPPKTPPSHDLPMTGTAAGVTFALGVALVVLSSVLRRLAAPSTD